MSFRMVLLGLLVFRVRARYTNYVPLSSSLGTLGELCALCHLMVFGRGYRWLVGC